MAGPLPRLTILSQGEQRVITCDEGLSLRDALDTTDLKVRSGCNGSGACGLCRVRIDAGNAGRIQGNERLLLTKDELHDNVRLACQVVPSGDLRVTVINPAPKTDWKRLIVDEPRMGRTGGSPAGCRAPGDKESYGVAVDLGTTNVSMSLWDLKRGVRLSSVFGHNRQSSCGSDVMTRLISACDDPARADEISRLAAQTIEAGIIDMCRKEGYDPLRVRRISVVGNTAMLALLVGKNGDLLLRPDHWTAPIDCRPENGRRWFEGNSIRSDVSLEIVQPVGGFVGSDLLAGIVATGLAEGSMPGLLIDFGTNSEIALWDGGRLWVTSAAGGPAFEGWGIRCGMPAEFGAIYKVEEIREETLPKVYVLGGGEARGICGSGIVDIIANLVRKGRLSALGKLTEGTAGQGILVARGASDIILDNRDVDVFQRAKAAIGAGVRVLSKLSGIDVDGLQRICVCGSFGRFLNIQNAGAIGLLPPADPERVEIWGTAALAGCESLLLSTDMRAYLESLTVTRTTLINLSRVSEFDEYFMESLYLRPLQTGSAS